MVKSFTTPFMVALSLFASLTAGASDSAVQVGTFATQRNYAAAIRLADGRILITGGSDGSYGLPCVTSADIYDPATGTLQAVGPLTEPRKLHEMALLADGRVLVVGGYCGFMADNPSAEIFDPVTNTFSRTGYMAYGRARFTATTLLDGRVLVVGGSVWGTRSSVGTATAPRCRPPRSSTRRQVRARASARWPSRTGSTTRRSSTTAGS